MNGTVTEYAVGRKGLIWPPDIIWHDFCTKTRARQELRDQRKRFRKLGESKENLSKTILLEREVHFGNWRRMS